MSVTIHRSKFAFHFTFQNFFIFIGNVSQPPQAKRWSGAISIWYGTHYFI